MFAKLSIKIGLLFFLLGSSLAWGADSKRDGNSSASSGSSLQNPNAISFELLGRGILYSFNYDRELSQNFALGAGYVSYSATSGSSSATLTVIPLYANWYFSPGPHRGFLTAGADLVMLSASLSGYQLGASGLAPIAGGGYEYRGPGGFLFRGTGYLVVGTVSSTATIGLTFGYAF